MLGKLLKYEWNSVGRILPYVNLAILVITAIGCVVLSSGALNGAFGAFLTPLLFLFYIVSLTSFMLLTLLYLYVRFYRNLYSREGYLMHTLPVTPLQLFHSKLIVGFFWTFLNDLLIILSPVGLVVLADKGSGNPSILQFFSEDGLGQGSPFSFRTVFGYSLPGFILLLLLLTAVGCFSALLTGYVSILLGQLVEKYKAAAAVGFYFVFYMANQIISSISILLPNFQLLAASSEPDAVQNFLPRYLHGIFSASLITQLVIGIILYLVCVLLARRQVNLD